MTAASQHRRRKLPTWTVRSDPDRTVHVADQHDRVAHGTVEGAGVRSRLRVCRHGDGDRISLLRRARLCHAINLKHEPVVPTYPVARERVRLAARQG